MNASNTKKLPAAAIHCCLCCTLLFLQTSAATNFCCTLLPACLPAEKDAVKIKKLREKQEKQQMAAFRWGQGCGGFRALEHLTSCLLLPAAVS